jgi:hypothetical protein
MFEAFAIARANRYPLGPHEDDAAFRRTVSSAQKEGGIYSRLDGEPLVFLPIRQIERFFMVPRDK